VAGIIRNLPADFLPLLIGSLPHTDVTDAVKAGFRFCPDSPSWPQLPKLSPFEGMNMQYLEGIPGWHITGSKLTFKNSRDIIDEISAAMEDTLAGNADAFALSAEHSRAFGAFIEKLSSSPCPEFVKGQVIGPVTFLTSHITDDGRRLIQDDGYRELIPRCLNMKARFQLEKYRAIYPGIDTIIFFDEPILAEIGSAVTSINKEDVREMLTTAREGLDARVGVHICGNSDWDFILDLPLDIINFDSYSFGEQFFIYRDKIKSFMEQGGCIAFGIVPTDTEALLKETEATIIEKASGQMRLLENICGKEAPSHQVFFTPSCGMGTLTVELAEKAMGILSALSEKYRK
jgi:methionine synthase II (cobalamin-independent)